MSLNAPTFEGGVHGKQEYKSRYSEQHLRLSVTLDVDETYLQLKTRK